MLLEPPNAGDTADGDVLALEVDGADLARMRRRVAEQLSDLDPEFVQDVELVCTELAANACDHAEGPHLLVLRRHVAEVRVEVSDGSPDRSPQVGASTLGPHRGHGMRMVESLSSSWGIRVADDTKTVWAELPIA
ncbi:ATP-binding protein [Actinosynnema sp. NPDC020468]|uniref:ATP-binding protein n=1 Tax=Actinosynnema sp. NPDC020468 TaxID=3154488 RepID=UPI0033DC359D